MESDELKVSEDVRPGEFRVYLTIIVSLSSTGIKFKMSIQNFISVNDLLESNDSL